MNIFRESQEDKEHKGYHHFRGSGIGVRSVGQDYSQAWCKELSLASQGGALGKKRDI